MTLPISRYPVPDLQDLPEDMRSRILQVQDKAGFVPNVFLTLAHRPAEWRAFFAYHDALMVAELGMSPKELCRLFRFDAVIGRLTSGESSLAEVAAATGYADQSHLTREFHQMVGCSPTTWLAEERRNIQDGGHRNRPH